MPSEAGHPTWLHFQKNLIAAADAHHFEWPISLKRVAGSPAPEKGEDGEAEQEGVQGFAPAPGELRF